MEAIAPAVEDKAFAQAMATLSKISTDVDNLTTQLFELPRKVVSHATSLAFRVWRERQLAASSSPSPSGTLSERSAKAFALRRQFGQLQYQTAGLAEMFLQKLFSLDGIQGDKVRPHRKMIVLRCKALIRRADQIKAHLDRLEKVHSTLDSLVSKPQPNHAEGGDVATDMDCPASPATAAPMDSEAPEATTSASTTESQQATKPEPASEPAPEPAPKPVAEESGESDDDDDDTGKSAFIQARQTLERFNPQLSEESLPRGVRVIVRAAGVPRDRLWVEVNQRARTVKVQGVRYGVSLQPTPPPFGFGFGFSGFDRLGRQSFDDAAPEPNAWFESILQIDDRFDLTNIKCSHEGSNLVLTIPKVSPPQSQPQRHKQQAPALNSQRRRQYQQQPARPFYPSGSFGFPAYQSRSPFGVFF